MTQHRHTIPKGANQTASVTDPDLSPYATTAALQAEAASRLAADAALGNRVSTLEASMANVLLRLAAVEAHFTPAPVPTGTLQQIHDAAASGAVVDLGGGTFVGPVNITKPLTLKHGTITGPTDSGSRWVTNVSINSDNVNVTDLTFIGGGQVVAVFGHSHVVIARNTFSGQIGSAITIWGQGVGSNYVTVDANHITQTATTGVSPIMGRGSEDESIFNDHCAFTNNVFDQGSAVVGHFGMELKDHSNTTITGNTMTGGECLVSLPNCRTATVSGNTFNLTGSAYWGVEVAAASDVTITGNTFYGDGSGGADHAVSCNSGAARTQVVSNTAHDIRTLVDLGGDSTTITDNCLTNVLRVTEFDSSGTNTVATRNGPC